MMHKGLRELRQFIELQYEINQRYCEPRQEIELWPHIQSFDAEDDVLRRVYNAYNRIESKVEEYPDLVMLPRGKEKLIYNICVKPVPEAVDYYHHDWLLENTKMCED